jgi:hypothetical protein
VTPLATSVAETAGLDGAVATQALSIVVAAIKLSVSPEVSGPIEQAIPEFAALAAASMPSANQRTAEIFTVIAELKSSLASKRLERRLAAVGAEGEARMRLLDALLAYIRVRVTPAVFDALLREAPALNQLLT